MERSKADTNTTPVVRFNNDCLIQIFKYLDTQSKGRAAQVCSTWREAADDKSLWKNEEVCCAREFCRQAYESLANRGIKCLFLDKFSPHLQMLGNLQSLGIFDECIIHFQSDFFQHFKHLQKLSVCNCRNVDDNFLNIIARYLQSLEELNISECENVTNEGLGYLPSCLKKLKAISINSELYGPYPRCQVSDIGVNFLANMITLEHVSFRSLEKMKNLSLSHIGQNLENLLSLDLHSCRKISNEGCKHLSQLNKLEYLNIAGCYKITDKGLKYIAKIKSLRNIVMSGCHNISDDGLKRISRESSITALDISLCDQITDVGLGTVVQLTSLQYLKIRGSSQITSLGLLDLSKGDLNLKYLDLTSCFKIDNAGLQYISEGSFVNTLQYFRLDTDQCDVTDEACKEFFEKHPNIKNPDAGQEFSVFEGYTFLSMY